MKLNANRKQILGDCRDLSLQDMGVLWLIMCCMNKNGEFEMNQEELARVINLKNTAALKRSLKNLQEASWVEKIGKNTYLTRQIKIKC